MAEVVRAEEVKKVAVSTDSNSNLMAALAWLFAPISSLVFILVDSYKKDKFIQFWAWESLAYSVAAFVISVVLSTVTLGLASCLIGPAFLVLWVLGAYKAYQGETWKLPYIGDWAEQQADKTVAGSKKE
ncbi:hypothetical protein COZ14_01035 [Candidatus Dojkabacteria bacterium CG_4_10_14_3_um_filter_Dojkabacteria_WS6_41_9]|uniref:DUF4870 domain-containing protein n=1 Tax=Candidatus Dojkabacteria bacterium CG_4_10_14_0_2_um_filter_Dojkabacteria_WS6_41_15 TaxID=2014249 RepID=A0A2M7W2C3_9BACT|nr:MAG: hypothetical protein COZ14_01035 [Candidatus Dojkabacteria bacterium CG_4_10_14_3_um_filter_Dojkabacteria_WS6_41_9]PJA14645.1 MAG: hypothetical protein COX64_01745 [Candidatus Dojkabacteria bacterium CG_4_10_14_0_2_um_filter_Dojkabacteria_WS6_41_15]